MVSLFSVPLNVFPCILNPPILICPVVALKRSILLVASDDYIVLFRNLKFVKNKGNDVSL